MGYTIKTIYALMITLSAQCTPVVVAAQQGEIDTSIYLTREQSRLIVPPQRYLFMPQLDLMIGAGRVYRGDKPRISYSIMHKGVYQATGILFFSIGGGYTRINSLTPRSGENSADSLRFADIIQAPVGLSMILGDDKAQVTTGLHFIPACYLNTSSGAASQRRFVFGIAPEFGFILRIKHRLYLGMIGKIQLFRHFDLQYDGWPRYGFAGVGAILRYN